LHPSAGEICVCGLVPYKKRKENAMNIGVVFGQRSRLVWELPMEDTFALYKEIYRIEPAVYRKNVDMFVEMLSMGDYLKTPVRQLSLGQRMRVEIALAMLHDPKILFLDEPTIGLDVVAKKYIRDFFRERNARDGVTIILTSHDMKDLDAIAKRIIMITKGTLLFDGSLDDLRAKYSENISVEFLYAEPLAKECLEGAGNAALDDSGYKLTVGFNPKEKKLQEIIAMAGAFGEIDDISVKSADIEDIVREIYNRG
jgi:ABC-2 type transport system ATP-binding protein